MITLNLLSPTSMNARFFLAASIGFALSLTACDRKTTAGEPARPVMPTTLSAEPVAKTSTFETARIAEAIKTFEKAPTVKNQSAVKLAFAELDGEIAELDDRVVKSTGSDRADAAAKLKNLQDYRDAETIRFAKAQVGTGLEVTSPADGRSGTQKISDTATKVGESIKDGTQKVGRTLEKGAKNTGDAIKDATH